MPKVKSTYGAFHEAVKKAAESVKAGTEMPVKEWAALAGVERWNVKNYATRQDSLLEKVGRGRYRRVAK